MISVIAAIHSYEATAKPTAKPEPDIAINCSAEILAAISEEPIAHHGKDFPAKKYSSAFFFSPFLPFPINIPIKRIIRA